MTPYLLLFLLFFVITMKGFYHARIYIHFIKKGSKAPKWLLKYGEQHFVSVASDVVLYTLLLLLGVHWLAVMGVAFFAYASIFNGLIQLSFGNPFWHPGPYRWRLLGLSIPRPLYKYRKSHAVVGLLMAIAGVWMQHTGLWAL